jgi:light-regulated signal transduction histidine kinase (bacteriophytochrome)
VNPLALRPFRALLAAAALLLLVARLALARTTVVERHAGSLTFETEPGRGTTFHVRSPIAPVPAEAAA